ncbi:MAG: TSUP family transporter [Firmicutes bacterium]|nr:TSUP family transporter [Bacillota bacterium]
MTKSKIGTAALLFCGIIAGILNGLIGVGGGVVIVYAVGAIREKFHGTAISDEPHDVFATAVASVLPMTIVSVILRAFAAGESLLGGDDIAEFVVPAVAGGALGAFFLGKISSLWLTRLFSCLTVWAGVSMILREAGLF